MRIGPRPVIVIPTLHTTLHLVALSAALLLVPSGIAKLRAPQPAGALLLGLRVPLLRRLSAPSWMRLLGGVELAAAAAFAGFGGRLPALVLAALYTAFTGVVAVALRRGATASCGCFGAADSPVGRAHLGVDLVALTAGVASALAPARPLGGLTQFGAGAAVVAAAQVLLLTALAYLCITALPALAAARRAAAP